MGWLLLLWSGCALPQETVPLPDLDVAFYQDRVHPVVRYTCASLECHGVDGRPLRLYSEDGLRADAALRGRDLSADEAASNVLAFAGVDPAPPTPDEHIALTKPLSVRAGGLAHLGGDLDLWPDVDDPSYRCLRGWLAGDLSVGGACDEASEALQCGRAPECDETAMALGCAICGP